MLPACIQVCPVELPGRGRKATDQPIYDVRQLASHLAERLPLSDKPYAIFGTCLGAIVGYELVREVERSKRAPLPLAFMPAAVSPPHLYGDAVAGIYLKRRILSEQNLSYYNYGNAVCKTAKSTVRYASTFAGRPNLLPAEEVMQTLSGWQDLPRETILRVFRAGNFAGVDEMERSDALFQRVAPMAINDIVMAVQYRCGSRGQFSWRRHSSWWRSKERAPNVPNVHLAGIKRSRHCLCPSYALTACLTRRFHEVI